MKILLVANTSWFLVNFELPLIKEFQAKKWDVVAVVPKDEWTSNLEKLGVTVRDVTVNRRGLNPFLDVVLCFRLYQMYKQEKPDAVFHNTIKPVIYGSLAARFADSKSVLNMIPGLGYVFAGDKFINKLLQPLVRSLYKYALSNSRIVYFQNPDDRDYFVSRSLVPQDKAEVTFGLGVDLNHFQYSPPVDKNGECIFLLVARMLWDKGVGEFVEAAKVIRNRFPKATFQLLGRIDSGNPNHVTKETIDEWVRAGYIQYLGEVSDVRSIVEHADVVVLPSYYREGIPNSLMEAMAMGRPIITTDMPGCRETIIGNRNGVLIPPKNIEALIDAMKLLLEHPDRRIEMGKQGRSIAVERFNVDRVNSMILSAIRDAR